MDELNETIARLRRENESLRQSRHYLLSKIEKMTETTAKYNQVHEMLRRLRDRIGFIISFVRFLREGHFTFESTKYLLPCIGTNFMRNIFEAICHQTTELSDIEVIFTSAVTPDTARLFDQLRQYIYLSIGQKLKVEQFELIKVISSSKQHIHCIFQNNCDLLSVRMIPSLSDTGLFSPTMFVMSPIGMTSLRTDINLFECLESIYFKQMYMPYSPNLYQDQAFPRDSCNPFDIKSRLLKEMYRQIGSKMFFLLEQGYRLAGKGPIYRMETEYDCLITSMTPPYPVYKLRCGHELSTLAYKGMIYTSNPYSEALRCPFCRLDLIVEYKEYPRRQTDLQSVRLKEIESETKE